MALEARCRNCGNTGLDMFGKPCKCRLGKAVAQIVAKAAAKVAANGRPCAPCKGTGTIYTGVVQLVCMSCHGTGKAKATQIDAVATVATVVEPSVTNDFLARVADELARARKKHPPMHSHHEAYAVLLEELAEVWDEVRRQQPDVSCIVDELTQVAAMCNRWVEDLCGATLVAGSEEKR